MRNGNVFKGLIVLLAAIAVAGCATTRKTETRRVYSEVKSVTVGDDVRVATKDGRKLDFRVTAVDERQIQGKGVTVARSDIASVKKLGTKTVTTETTSAEPAAQAFSTAVLAWMVVCIVAIAAVF